MKKLILRAVAVMGAVGLVLIALMGPNASAQNGSSGNPRFGIFETDVSQFVPIETDTTTTDAITNMYPTAQAVADLIVIQAPAAGNICYSLGTPLTIGMTTGMVTITSNTVQTIDLSGLGGANAVLYIRMGVGTVQASVSSNASIKVIGHY